MDETDWPPSRLAAAIEAAIALILRKCRIAPQDHVGVIAYAEKAWWVAPCVSVEDGHEALCSALRGIETTSATNITASLQLTQKASLPATKRSLLDRLLPLATPTSSTEETLRIILLTDGYHNTGKDPRSTAKALKRAGVCINCIGIGGEPCDVDHTLLRAIASRHPDNGTPRYAFIGDKDQLIEKFQELAGRITR